MRLTSSATVFVSFLGSSLDKLQVNRWLWAAGFGSWLLGLVVAIIAGTIAYRAQETFVRAIRNRRHSAGLAVLGDSYRKAASIEPNQTNETLHACSLELQSSGDKGWKFAWLIGIISVCFFLVGACLALATVITAVPITPHAPTAILTTPQTPHASR